MEVVFDIIVAAVIAIIAWLLIFYAVDAILYEDLSFILKFGPRFW